MATASRLFAALLLLAAPAAAEIGWLRFNVTVAELPAACTASRSYWVVDGASSTDCATGSGSTIVECICNTDGTSYTGRSLTAGGSSNSFETINAPAGTDPVAESSTDTLNLTTTSPLTITGNSTTDTVAFAWSGTFPDAQISESSVTQHQAALSVTESQVSDLDHAEAFTTQNAPAGTDPVADALADTLNWTVTGPLVLTGNSTTDTMAFSWSGAFADAQVAQSNVTQHQAALSITESQISDLAHTTDTTLSQEQVEDFAGGLVANVTGTHTGLTITYQDATGDMDFVLDNLAGDVTGPTSATVVGDDSHAHTTTTVSGLDISADTNLAVSAPVTLTGDTVGLNQNAGTDVTADLEEEAHATEHAENAADELLVENLGTACTDGQIPKANATGGIDCGTDATGGGGTPNILDLGDDASNESTDLIEIATTGDTNSIFTEPSADKLLIAVGNNWPTADAATALSAAASYTFGDNSSATITLNLDAGTTDSSVLWRDATDDFRFSHEISAPSFQADASATPTNTFDDSDDAGTIDASITNNCPTANDCDLDFAVNSGLDTETVVLKIDTTDAGATTVQIGAPGTNYVNISEAGAMDFQGTADIDLPTDSVDAADVNFNYVDDATASQGLLLTGTEGATLGLIDCAATEVLKRNAGDTAWECAADATGSGTPGGADTQVQYNNAGAFGGSANLTWDNTNRYLTLGSAGNLARLQFGDGDTYVYENADDTLDIFVTQINKRFTAAGVVSYRDERSGFGGAWVNWSATPSATVPSIGPDHDDRDSGLGWIAGNQWALVSGGVQVLQLNTATSGVNYVSLTPAATGADPTITAAGSDANVDLVLTGQGTGVVDLTGGVSFPSSVVITGDWDFGGGGIEIENGTTPPACTVGQLYLDTDATSGQQLMACEGGTFVLQGDGGAGGGDPVLIDGVGVADASGVDLQGGANITITFNAGASPDTASFAVDDSFLLNTGDTLTTGNLVLDGVDIDFNTGTGDAFPLLLNDATPDAPDCNAASEYGRLIFDPDLDTEGSVMVCTSAGWKDIDDDGGAGSGDITDVFECATGDCASITMAATDLLDMSGTDASTATEGLILPQHATACAGGTADGQPCWEADANILHIGDGAGLQDFPPASAISGDATMSGTGALTIAADAVALGTDTTGNYAAGDAEAGAALTGDSATAFFAAGAIEAARGGTGGDSSASTGAARVSAGTWSYDATLAHLGASTGQIDDDDLAAGAVDGGVGGEIADGTVDANDLATDAVGAAELASTAIQAGDIEAGDLPADGYAATYLNDDGDTATGAHNYSGALLEVPNSTTLTATDCDVAGEAGRVFVDTDATSGQQFYVCEGTSGWVLQGDGAGGGTMSSFDITDTDASPVLTVDNAEQIQYIGAGTVTVDAAADGANHDVTITGSAHLTEEQVEDFAGPMVATGGTKTGIAVTYQDATNDMDFVVDNLENLAGTLDVASGGTGATTLTDGGILLGSGTGAITALGVATNGQIPIGDGTTDPVLATITATANETEVTNGAGSITIGLVASPTIGGANITALSGSNISTGTVDEARLDANVVLDNASNTYSTGAQDFSSATSVTFAANEILSSEIATEVRSMYWPAGSLSTDGTQCATPAEVTLNSGPRQYTISCADNAASIVYGHVVMPDGWNAGTVTFEIMVWHGTTETITYAGDFSAQCRGDAEIPSSTWGTAQAADVAITTANRIEQQTTAAVTATGTCAAGDALFWRWVMDAATTPANGANTDILGVKMEYTTNVGD